MYPTVLPVDAIQVFIETALHPQTADKVKLISASYKMLGYVLGQAFGEPATLVNMNPQLQQAVNTLGSKQ